MLNKQKGNMYSFVTHTKNYAKGICEYGCDYCFMKRFPQKKIRLDESEFKDDMGSGNFIFIGSSCDMWSDSVPDEWIERILAHCKVYPKNTYLFQTKNPKRYHNFDMPPDCVLGTTIETNREALIEQHSKAPEITARVYWMMQLPKLARKMVTIEPIMDFDVFELSTSIKNIIVEWVNIGADSKGHNLPEPSPEKVESLVKELLKFTKVNIKPNLKRVVNTPKPNKRS